MGADSEAPAPPRELPPEAIEVLGRLTEAELRAAIDYARARREYAHPEITAQIKPNLGEEIVRIEERQGYTEVVKRQTCPDGCTDCPHGPFLYHVREELRPEDGTHLHWVYLGRIQTEDSQSDSR